MVLKGLILRPDFVKVTELSCLVFLEIYAKSFRLETNQRSNDIVYATKDISWHPQ